MYLGQQETFHILVFVHTKDKSQIQKENLPNLLTHEPRLKSPSQILLNIPSYKIHKPKVQVFDPNNKINQPVLFHDLLSKSKKLKINYEKFAEEIIKISFIKSKDQLANFLFKAIGSKTLKNIFGKFGLGDPKTKLEGECRKVEY